MSNSDIDSEDDSEELIKMFEKEVQINFNDWVSKIYRHQTTTSQIQIPDNYGLYLSPAKINRILLHNLQIIVQAHVELMFSRIQDLQNQCARSDGELQPLGEKKIQQEEKGSKGKQDQKKGKKGVRMQEIDEECRLIICEQFGRIGKANREISILTEQIEESNESNYIHSYPQAERYCLRKRDEESYKENELNKIAFDKFIPPNYFQNSQSVEKLFSLLFSHSNKFQLNNSKYISQQPALNSNSKSKIHKPKSIKQKIFFIVSFLQKNIEDQPLKCYGEGGEELNLHDYISLNNFGTDKQEESQRLKGEIKEKDEEEGELMREKDIIGQKERESESVIKMLEHLQISKRRGSSITISKKYMQKWQKKYESEL